MENENRKRVRYPVIALAKMKAGNQKGATIVTAMVNDICRFGMGLCSVSPLTEGTEVSVEFIETTNNRYEDSIKGSIAWISEDKCLYSMGLCFDEELNPDNQPNIFEDLFSGIR